MPRYTVELLGSGEVNEFKTIPATLEYINAHRHKKDKRKVGAKGLKKILSGNGVFENVMRVRKITKKGPLGHHSTTVETQVDPPVETLSPEEAEKPLPFKVRKSLKSKASSAKQGEVAMPRQNLQAEDTKLISKESGASVPAPGQEIVLDSEESPQVKKNKEISARKKRGLVKGRLSQKFRAMYNVFKSPKPVTEQSLKTQFQSLLKTMTGLNRASTYLASQSAAKKSGVTVLELLERLVQEARGIGEEEVAGIMQNASEMHGQPDSDIKQEEENEEEDPSELAREGVSNMFEETKDAEPTTPLPAPAEETKDADPTPPPKRPALVDQDQEQEPSSKRSRVNTPAQEKKDLAKGMEALIMPVPFVKTNTNRIQFNRNLSFGNKLFYQMTLSDAGKLNPEQAISEALDSVRKFAEINKDALDSAFGSGMYTHLTQIEGRGEGEEEGPGMMPVKDPASPEDPIEEVNYEEMYPLSHVNVMNLGRNTIEDYHQLRITIKSPPNISTFISKTREFSIKMFKKVTVGNDLEGHLIEIAKRNAGTPQVYAKYIIHLLMFLLKHKLKLPASELSKVEFEISLKAGKLLGIRNQDMDDEITSHVRRLVNDVMQETLDVEPLKPEEELIRGAGALDSIEAGEKTLTRTTDNMQEEHETLAKRRAHKSKRRGMILYEPSKSNAIVQQRLGPFKTPIDPVLNRPLVESIAPTQAIRKRPRTTTFTPGAQAGVSIVQDQNTILPKEMEDVLMRKITPLSRMMMRGSGAVNQTELRRRRGITLFNDDSHERRAHKRLRASFTLNMMNEV